MRVDKSIAFWLLMALATFIVAFAPLPAGEHAQAGTRTIRVEASQFSYSPSVISVRPGETVTIELVSMDVVHGLYVDGYGVSVEADPGQTETVTFIANRPGSFRIRCNVTCGAMHPFMIGKFNVGSNATLVRSIGFALIAIASVTLFSKPKTDNAAQPGALWN